jgi:hypothetical protein
MDCIVSVNASGVQRYVSKWITRAAANLYHFNDRAENWPAKCMIEMTSECVIESQT